MLFNSLTFLIFFAVVMFLHRLPVSWRTKKINLLIASYVFYAAWSPPFVLLLWISTGVDWFAAKAMHSAESKTRRRGLMALSLMVNLGLLGYFKYGGFMMENLTSALGLMGIEYRPPASSIILPVGISFYTFQTLSYSLDVYRGGMKPWRSFLDFALFVTFFPQLVAGPIVRAKHFLPQCREPRRADGDQIGWGLSLLALGLFEKTVLADYCLAPVANAVFGAPGAASTLDAWLGTFAFSGQIFFDFAGYSTCAIGVAMCLGFSIPDNFRFPYAAIGFSDFWRRWHISLSTWLRDYLYIPLGGSRMGIARTYLNVMATMLIGGLWHGASWRFVVWGGLHGLYLGAERLVNGAWGDRPAPRGRASRLGLALVTFLLVSIAWVFFRAQDFSGAIAMLRAMFGAGGSGLELGSGDVNRAVLAVAGLLVGSWLLREGTLEQAVDRAPRWMRSAALTGILLMLALAPGDDRAFIYFQF